MSGRWVEGPDTWRPRTAEELDRDALIEAKARSEMMGYGGPGWLKPRAVKAIRYELEQADLYRAEDPAGWVRYWIEDPAPEGYRELSKVTVRRGGNVLGLAIYCSHLDEEDVRWVEQAPWNRGESYQ